MRGVFTPVTQVRRQVFVEVAKMAYEDSLDKIEELPYKIIPGEVANYRESVFTERAVIGERIRLALGLNPRKANSPAPISMGIEKVKDVKLSTLPLVNVISFACQGCPTNSLKVTDNCRGCLAHPCVSVCPVNATSMIDGKSHIDQEKCIRCGRCKEACPYNAIVQYDRPCAAACGVDAIGSDEYGRAEIDYDKCVSCGQCIVACPFGAIADKSEIYQVIRSMQDGNDVYALVAPAIVGQFGPLATPEKIKSGIKALGFKDVVEVAIGGDLGSIAEANHFIHKIKTGEDKLLATSCCPSWSVMAKREFPELASCISMELTPMVATARIWKKEHPNAKMVFVGPCSAKKLEASVRKSVRSDVDFVITFEELMGMFLAKGIEPGSFEGEEYNDATSIGRGYAYAGGVTDAIIDSIHEIDPSVEVPCDRAEGLAECKKMLTLAKAGKRDGYLLEGMACPGGCVGGMGTIIAPNRTAASIKKLQKDTPEKHADESRYKDCNVD